jgi:hypothetical protein
VQHLDSQRPEEDIQGETHWEARFQSSDVAMQSSRRLCKHHGDCASEACCPTREIETRQGFLGLLARLCPK